MAELKTKLNDASVGVFNAIGEQVRQDCGIRRYHASRHQCRAKMWEIALSVLVVSL
jgi:hypothetical protein